MAHKLDFTTNASGDFVYRGEKPWHGFGTPQEKISFTEAITYGGLGYTVEKLPNIHKIGALEIVSDLSFFTYRTDSLAVLGKHVGSRYTCMQNTEALGIVDGFGDYEIETAGVLDEGRIAFICMKSTDQIIVGKDDVTNMYLLFVNSFDGTMPVTVLFTPIRVVCNNTLTAALQGCRDKYTFRHTTNASEKIREAMKIMGILNKTTDRLRDVFNQMSDIQVNPVDFIGHVFLTKEEIAELTLTAATGALDIVDISTRKKNIMRDALAYYENGPGQAEWRGTGWGCYNAVTGYLGNRPFDDAEDAMASTVLNLTYQNTSTKAAAMALAPVAPIAGLEKLLYN